MNIGCQRVLCVFPCLPDLPTLLCITVTVDMIIIIGANTLRILLQLIHREAPLSVIKLCAEKQVRMFCEAECMLVAV